MVEDDALLQEAGNIVADLVQLRMSGLVPTTSPMALLRNYLAESLPTETKANRRYRQDETLVKA